MTEVQSDAAPPFMRFRWQCWQQLEIAGAAHNYRPTNPDADAFIAQRPHHSVSEILLAFWKMFMGLSLRNMPIRGVTIPLFIGSKINIMLKIWRRIQGWNHNTSTGVMILLFTWFGSGITKNLKIWLWIWIQGRNHNTSNVHRLIEWILPHQPIQS